MLKINGFTLVELAIGMVIMSFLIGFFVLPLSMQRENADIQATQAALEQIKEAVIGYVLVNRHLPCPATTNSNGQENPIASGTCIQQHGFIPARTLNVAGSTNSNGLLLDTWGNPYHYSISTTDRSITTNKLKVCEDSACITTVVAENAPVVIFSTGKNGSQTPSSLEAKNLKPVISLTLPGDNYFIQAPYNNNSNSANRFDDIVVWISPYILYNRMVQAGVYPP